MREGKLLFLGTGGSMGIPVIGCECSVCRSENSNNKRLRPSALLTIDEKQILIDVGPDFRAQALKFGIKTIDGLIVTHCHHDHTAGIDELRVFNMRTKKSLPCLLSDYTAEDLRRRFTYMFVPRDPRVLITQLDLTILEGDTGSVDFLGVPLQHVTFEQGGIPVNGFRIGNLGFISDIKHYDESIFETLAGVETLVLSALRNEPSPMHFTFEEAIAFAKRVGAKQTWFTHIAHEAEHEATNRELPENIQLAYDGLEIPFTLEN